ncbi:MAG: hypothetical protein AAB275_02940 [Deltaproteobacteria bacterium]|mgnify:CR=1 FL=1
MEELKLFLVFHTGGGPCWQMRVAKSAEDALFQCFGTGDHAKNADLQKSCRVEEVKVPGYEIVVRQKR